jgi:hypothetical protein
MKTEVAMLRERCPDTPTNQTHKIAMAESIRVCPCSTVSNDFVNGNRGAAA